MKSLQLFLLVVLATMGITPASAQVQYPDPSDNVRCWTQEACEKMVERTVNGKTTQVQNGRFDSTSEVAQRECPGYGFCYPMPEDVPLSVSFLPGQQTVVQGIGGYINTVFRFILGSVSIVAIVVLMIGGIGYMIGSTGMSIGKSKDRIMKALGGLLLLIFANLILFTVNPQLIRLDFATLPKVRPIQFLDGRTSCEDLLKQNETDGTKYEIDDANLACGDESYILKDDEGTDVSDQKFTCPWTTCSQTDPDGFAKACLVGKDGKSRCVSCQEVSSDNDVSLTPSANLCATLAPKKPEATAGTNKLRAECRFARDTDFNGISALTAGQCVQINYDCRQIDSCSDWDNVVAKSGGQTDILEELSGPGGPNDVSIIKYFCESNPCGETVLDGPCVLFTDAGPLGAAVGRVGCVSRSDSCLNDIDGCW